MAIEIDWLIPNRIILSKFTGTMTLEDVEGWLEIQMKMVEEGTPLVHHISNSLELDWVEIRLKTFQTLMKGISKSENFGWHIEITKNPVNRMVSNIVTQFAKVHTRSYTNMEQALAFLKENDPSLEGLEIAQQK